MKDERLTRGLRLQFSFFFFLQISMEYHMKTIIVINID